MEAHCLVSRDSYALGTRAVQVAEFHLAPWNASKGLVGFMDFFLQAYDCLVRSLKSQSNPF
jgi:hypothetical protein